jgi:3-deoxy-7-phosphoheptulonate synthase
MSACISPPAVAAQSEAMSDVVHIGGAPVGGPHFTAIAGPCAVESREMALQTVLAVQAAGAAVLRAGVFKPRTSPHSFQGLGSRGLEILREVKAATGMPVVTEVTDVRRLDEVGEVADALQVGARNMQNYTLLTELGRTRVPVLLKRGFSATVDELLQAAEYILCEGNHRVILCERGIRTFEKAYRFTLDVGAVAVLRERTRLPVVVDPSHAAGRRALVLPLSLAALAAGADGLIVEVHPAPRAALCDGEQALTADGFGAYLRHVGRLARFMGRRFDQVPGPTVAAIPAPSAPVWSGAAR